MDRIVIPGLPLRARVGVTDAERAVAQEIELHVELGLDLTAAGAHDDLGRTVDYDAVCEHLGSVARLTEFRLIEAIAETCARTLLATFPSVDEARVEVRKPAALRSHGVAYAAVEVTRRRG